MKATFQREVKINEMIDGRELAELFWQMSADEQADFFTCLGTKEKLATQMEFVRTSSRSNPYSKLAMRMIGEFS